MFLQAESTTLETFSTVFRTPRLNAELQGLRAQNISAKSFQILWDVESDWRDLGITSVSIRISRGFVGDAPFVLEYQAAISANTDDNLLQR